MLLKSATSYGLLGTDRWRLPSWPGHRRSGGGTGLRVLLAVSAVLLGALSIAQYARALLPAPTE